MARPDKYAYKAIKSPGRVTLDALNDLSVQQLREVEKVIDRCRGTPEKVQALALICEELERARIHEARPSLLDESDPNFQTRTIT